MSSRHLRCNLPLFDFQVLPYFKKSESQIGRFSSDTTFHGTDGPQTVRDSIFVSPLADLYQKMARKFEFLIQDFNAGNQTAFDVPQVSSWWDGL